MKTGRNDPCPCGSGRKYKKCCMSKDRDAPPPPLLPTSPLPARDPAPPPPAKPRKERPLTPVERRWEEFRKADYEGRIALFLKTLDEPELLDHENAFEMLNELSDAAVKRGQRERFVGLVRLLRERLPDVYAEGAFWNAGYLLDAALEAGDTDAIAAAGLELAENAHKASDPFSRHLAEVAYRGHLLIARDVMRRAWPLLRDEADLFEWARHEYAEQGATFELYARLEEEPALAGDDPVLLERTRFFVEDLDEAVVARRVELLTGRATAEGNSAAWALALERPEEDEDEEGGCRLAESSMTRLTDLSWEFARHLRMQGVPSSKAELEREPLVEYVAERACGGLRDERRPPRSWQGPGGGPTDWLVPERATLERLLRRMLGFFSWQTYQAAAVFEAVPAWLRFLEGKGLITADRRGQALALLHPLVQQLRSLAEPGAVGPGFAAVLDAWGQEPAAPTSA
jgi:hypothetical protein